MSIHDPLYEADGTPILNDDGSPITGFDVIARATQLAQERGDQIVVGEDADGGLTFRYVANPDKQTEGGDK